MRNDFIIKRFVTNFSEIIGDFESNPLKDFAVSETLRKIYTLYGTYFKDSITLLSSDDRGVIQATLKDNLLDNHAFRVASMIVAYLRIMNTLLSLTSVKCELYFFGFYIIGSEATVRYERLVKIGSVIEFYDLVTDLEKQMVSKNMIGIDEFTLTVMSSDDFDRLDQISTLIEEMRSDFIIKRFSEIIGDFESNPLKDFAETFFKIDTLYGIYFKDSITLLSSDDRGVIQATLKDNLLDNHAFRVASMIVAYRRIMNILFSLKSVKCELYFFRFYIRGSETSIRYERIVKIASVVEFYDIVTYLEKQIVSTNMIGIDEFTLTVMSSDDFDRLDQISGQKKIIST